MGPQKMIAIIIVVNSILIVDNDYSNNSSNNNSNSRKMNVFTIFTIFTVTGFIPSQYYSNVLQFKMAKPYRYILHDRLGWPLLTVSSKKQLALKSVSVEAVCSIPPVGECYCSKSN